MAVEYWCVACKEPGCIKCILATCATHKYVELSKVADKALANGADALQSGRRGLRIKGAAVTERVEATRAAIEYRSEQARINVKRHLLDVRRQFALYEQRVRKAVEDHHADALDRVVENERRALEELETASALWDQISEAIEARDVCALYQLESREDRGAISLTNVTDLRNEPLVPVKRFEVMRMMVLPATFDPSELADGASRDPTRRITSMFDQCATEFMGRNGTRQASEDELRRVLAKMGRLDTTGCRGGVCADDPGELNEDEDESDEDKGTHHITHID